MPDDETVTVLLVDDDEIDRKIVQRAFEVQKISNPIVEARDGCEALEMLRGKKGSEPLSRPYLVLLDLNMPRMNGMEFLAEVRKDDQLKDSVVFVLTTSRTEQDRLQAYQLNVAGYMVKSAVGAGFFDAVEMLDLYWHVVKFPL